MRDVAARMADLAAAVQTTASNLDGNFQTGADDSAPLSEAERLSSTPRLPDVDAKHIDDIEPRDEARPNESSADKTAKAANSESSDNTTAKASQSLIDPSYTYDPNGNRITMTDPTGITRYTYDALNRLTFITNPKGQTITFEYDALGRRTKMAYPNDIVTTYTYNAAGRLLSLEARLGAAEITSFQYTYDGVGNRTSMTDLDGIRSYTYDELHRLIGVSHPQPSNPTEFFSYDPVGNRLSSHLSASYSYDAANRLQQDDNFTYDYDDNGNMIEKTDKSTGEVTVYIYDAENRLTEIQKFDSGGGTPISTSRYLYDGLGRRIEKNMDGVITRYVYDNEDILLELDGDNNILARYTYGPGIDEPLIMERDGESYFYHADGLGSIVSLTDGNGDMVQQYVYDTFGRIMAQSEVARNPYAYAGREKDESSLYYCRTRYYNPEIGRFLTEDPMGPNSLFSM
jgi:RHS repeat-associated protein